MSTREHSISRRGFITGGVLCAAGLVIASPVSAFAGTSYAEPAPTIVVTLEDAEGNLVDAFGEMSTRNASVGTLRLGETVRTLTQKDDGSFVAICETSIMQSADSRATKDDIYNDPYATVKVLMEYTFLRGRITVTSGTVQISNITSGFVLSPRHQLMFQGPLSHEGNMVYKEFTADSNTIVTGWPSVEYVPTGSSYKNACRFQGMINGAGVQNYLFAAEVTI